MRKGSRGNFRFGIALTGAKERNVRAAARRFDESLWRAVAATSAHSVSARRGLAAEAEGRVAVFRGFTLAGSTGARVKPARSSRMLVAQEADSARVFQSYCVLIFQALVKST